MGQMYCRDNTGMIGAKEQKNRSGADPRSTARAREAERVPLPIQMSFRWIAFMTASRRLWVRSFWLM
jgi:hypothetical protein